MDIKIFHILKKKIIIVVIPVICYKCNILYRFIVFVNLEKKFFVYIYVVGSVN